jgi:Zn-dependent protease/CBS domain-containing protein
LYAAVAGLTGSWKAALEGAALVLAVFGCVVLHELGHSVQVRRYGIRVRDIILFPIGGVARAESIPERPRHEIAVAVAGPVVNFGIAGGLFALLALTGSPPHAEGFLVDLAWVNLALGAFNLVPAYPMDGGRILRGALATRMPYLSATRRARDVGQLVALVFIVTAFVDTAFIMLALIAVFVFAGGMLEERMISTRLRLAGKSAGDVVDPDAPVFAATDRVETVATRMGTAGAGAYAVAAESGSLAGVIVTSDVLRAARDGRFAEPVGAIARYDFPVAEARAEATRVYSYLREARKPFAAIVDGDRFIGLFHADETLCDFPRGASVS